MTKPLGASRVTRRSGKKSGSTCPQCNRRVRPWLVARHAKKHAKKA